jgi:DNA repair protein RecO (recombination protein O)
MEIQKATGIVLYSRRLGEADVTARIFTREFGKRTFIFKGLKKSKTRPLSAAEPGTVLDLVYYFHENREYQVVNELRVSSRREHVHDDLARIYNLCYMLELIDSTTGSADPALPLYNLLAAALDALSSSPHTVSLSVFFTLHLMRMHGILPDLATCAACGRRDYERFALDFRHFHVVCESCAPQHTRGRRLLSASLRDYLTRAPSTRFGEMPHDALPEDELIDLLFFLALSVENYFRIELKSKGMLFARKRDEGDTGPP